MDLQKRNCGIEMRLVPYGAGWTDVHLNIGSDQLYFIISSGWGDRFSELLKILYHLHPQVNDQDSYNKLEYWDDICEFIDGKYKVTKIVENCDDCPATIQPIPYKGEFTWHEEGTHSHWSIWREPTEDTDFDIHINIQICRNDTKEYAYTVRYKDFCYAVAKTCTQVLKSHGIYGYHYSVYFDDLNLRHLLFIKAVALDAFEARQLTDNEDGSGVSSPFEKELQLLLFDM